VWILLACASCAADPGEGQDDGVDDPSVMDGALPPPAPLPRPGRGNDPRPDTHGAPPADAAAPGNAPDAGQAAKVSRDADPAPADPLADADLPPPSDPAPVTEHGAPVFDESKLQSYHFTLTDADWRRLQATAAQEQYVPATLRVGEDEVGRVGLRYKGAHGTFLKCISNGRITCKKLSFKVRFDKYDPERRYHGLKRLNFHSLINDRSQLHERLAYKLFREMGVHVPRSVHAKLYVNGDYKGLFAVTEQIDGRFTDHRFPKNGDGTLYKEAWPAREAWVMTTDLEYYEKRRKTNEGASHDKIRAFQRALAQASPADLPKVAETWVDVDYMLRVLAVDRTITNWDGPFTFYCSPFGCRNHNFYLYQEEKRDRFWLIPWDLDVTFGLDPPTRNVPSWTAPPSGCSPLPTTGFGAPSCDRLVRALALAGRPRYVAALRRFLDQHFVVARMHKDIDTWAAQISEAVRTDRNGPGFDVWRAAVTSFKNDLVVLRRRAEADANR
jgi:hypothetical protein